MARVHRSAVVTGYGVVSPLGTGVAAFWDGLVTGRSAIAPIRRFRADDLEPAMAAEVAFDDADPDRAGAFALRAASDALAAAALRPDAVEPTRLGVVLGTTLGGMELFEHWDATAASRGAAGGRPAPRALLRTRGASGRYAWRPRAGRHDAARVRLGDAGRRACGRVDPGRTRRRRPRRRHGPAVPVRRVGLQLRSTRRPPTRARSIATGEGSSWAKGAAVLVVEDEAHAARRGATARARVLGAGAAADAVHMTAPDREGRGVVRAIGAALAQAGLAPSAVDFVSAHGTGTPFNDAMEARALVRVFGERGVTVNGIKGAIGHTLGAAGAFEAVVCVETIARGVVPPTAGLREIDPACAGLDLVCDEPRSQDARVAVSTSSGFAGANAALVLGRA